MPSSDDAATLQAYFEGIDHTRAEVDREWGSGRLVMLVDDELRAKFNRQQTKWSDAYREAWQSERVTGPQLDAVKAHAAAMKRAYAALASAASEGGHRPISPEVWETTLADGTVVAVVRTDAEVGKVLADGRHLSVYSLREIAHVIDALPPALQLAKQVFPGAVIQQPTDKSWVRHGDQIPFGDAA